MAAAIGFGSDLQAAMAFSGILVVIMVAIFPGILKIEIAKSRDEKAVGWLLIAFGVAVGVVRRSPAWHGMALYCIKRSLHCIAVVNICVEALLLFPIAWLAGFGPKFEHFTGQNIR
jgi:hypothetical protein